MKFIKDCLKDLARAIEPGHEHIVRMFPRTQPLVRGLVPLR